MANRTVMVKLIAEASGLVGGFKQGSRAANEFSGSLAKAAREGKLDKVADQAARMGLALVGVAGAAVAMAAQFDKQMSEVAAVSGETGARLEKLRSAALQAGKDTAFSASEAAKAEAELAKAGLGASDILGGALTGSLSLAAAGQLDLADAADISAKAMNMFNLQGKDVGHIADVLAAAANKSATDVSELGMALKQGGLAASAAGLGLDETVGTLAAFADRALVGSDAGTSFKTMLQMLAAPTDKAKDLMKQLGINAYDASGQFIGTIRLAGELQHALGNLTQEQRNAALATIFGADAMRAANVLLDVGEGGLRDYVAAVNDQGAAAEVAAKKMDNLAGDVEKLKGSVETLAIESGSGANGGLRQLVQMADRLVGVFSGLPGPVQSGSVIVAGVGGAALLAFAGLIKMRRMAAEARAELEAMGPAGQRAAAGLDKAAKSAKIATAAFVGMEVFAAVVSTLSDAAIDVTRLDTALKKLGQTGQMTGELQRVLGGDPEQVRKYFGAASDGIFQSSMRASEAIPVFGAFQRSVSEAFHGASFTSAKENVKALDQQLASFASTTDDVSTAQAAYARLLSASGLSLDQFEKLMPAATEALHEAWQNADKAGKAQGQAGGAMNKMAEDAEAAAKKVEELKDAYDKLFGATMGADRASIAYQEGLLKLNDELAKGSHALHTNKKMTDEQKQKVLENRSAILDQIDAINDLRQANIDNGMEVGKANKTYDAQIAQLRKTLVQMGFNGKEVDSLIGKYRAIPKDIYSAAHLNTGPAKTAADNLRKYLHNIPDETINLALRVTGSRNASAAAAAIRKQYASAHGNIINMRTGLLEMAAGGIATSPTVLFGERQTGKEMFLPQRGISEERAMGLLQTGASWYGAKVVQQGAGAVMSSRIEVVLSMDPRSGGQFPDQFFSWIRGEVRQRGGELAVLNLKAPA